MKKTRARGCCGGSGSVQPAAGGWRSQSQTFLVQRSFHFLHGTLRHEKIAKHYQGPSFYRTHTRMPPTPVFHFARIIITFKTKNSVSQCIHNVCQCGLICDVEEEALIWITSNVSDFPKKSAGVSLSPEIVTKDLSSRWGSILK